MTSNQQDSQPTKDVMCEWCGSFEVLEIAGQNLCPECIATAGCGCAGHGGSED
jgi:hypothetical protein